MKKLLPLLLLMFVICQCSPVKREKRPATPRDQYPEKFTTEYIIKSAEKLIDYVPDHEFNPSIKPYMSEKYYSLLEEAWALPVVDFGMVGENEWLYYFLTGNDGYGSENTTKTILEAMAMDDWNAYVQMDYFGNVHDIVMHFENDDWTISNFDGTQDQLARYIKDQRAYLRSIEWESFTQGMVDEMKEYIPEDEIRAWISDFKVRVEAYFAKYPEER